MKIEEITEELLEEAKKCRTPEEQRKFIRDHHIEHPMDLLNEVSGGTMKSSDPDGQKETFEDHCPYCGSYEYKETGRKRPGWFIGVFDDKEMICNRCRRKFWRI